MARILITSGPTRQYLDPVRYLSNASSGRMGSCLAQAAIDLGHDVVVISGPVSLQYPRAAHVVWTESTEEMLEISQREFLRCDGCIGAAAPCDYRPVYVSPEKLSKTGEPLVLHLVETPDVIATLGQNKQSGQWVVGFALETEDRRFRSIIKLEKKHCDLMISNGPAAINSDRNSVELIDCNGNLLRLIEGRKEEVARQLLLEIDARLIRRG